MRAQLKKATLATNLFLHFLFQTLKVRDVSSVRSSIQLKIGNLRFDGSLKEKNQIWNLKSERSIDSVSDEKSTTDRKKESVCTFAQNLVKLFLIFFILQIWFDHVWFSFFLSMLWRETQDDIWSCPYGVPPSARRLSVCLYVCLSICPFVGLPALLLHSFDRKKDELFRTVLWLVGK